MQEYIPPFFKFSYLVDGCGDITYNSRRGLFGTLPVWRKISYHLFTVDPYSLQTGDVVKLCRKSRWHGGQLGSN